MSLHFRRARSDRAYMEVPKAAGVSSEIGQLASAVRQRLEGAEVALARHLQRVLRAMCRARRIYPPEADDLVQEAIMTVIERLRSHDEIRFDAMSAYARSVANNLLIADRRRDARRTELLQRVADDLQPEATPSPAQVLTDAKRVALVAEAIASLPQPRDRDMIREHYLNHVDKDTLCIRFDISARQFDRVLYRARGRLRLLLQQRGLGGQHGD